MYVISKRHLELEVSDSDYIRSRGRTAELRVGPFHLGASTADGGAAGFGVQVGRWYVACTFGIDESRFVKSVPGEMIAGTPEWEAKHA